MPEICVLYLSDDETVVESLVALLRKHWTVWWARDIKHGDWEELVRKAIPESSVIVPVMSSHAKGERVNILKDEMRFAKKCGKPILPFLIGPTDLPFGFGDFSRTEAIGWNGQENDDGYRALKARISATVRGGRGLETPGRPRELTIKSKTLELPAFVFSLSSHETQVMPKDGIELLGALSPRATLVSAYDAWKYKRLHDWQSFDTNIRRLGKTNVVLFLDSGNYEAYRKNDLYSPRRNRNGWRKEHFRRTVARLLPDIAFSFDTINPRGDPEDVAATISSNFRADQRAVQGLHIPLCPIVHLPLEHKHTIQDYAAHVMARVAGDLDPLLLAVPERELGDGLLERVRTVREVRKALNALGKYYPLHLLGTGNPLSMIALAAAGADAFDGLEWCRTIADYSNGYLFHFQQFECFAQTSLHRVQDPRIRHILEDPDASYNMRALSYNVDFFEDWARTMRSMIHSGQIETLLKMVPSIGPTLFKSIAV